MHSPVSNKSQDLIEQIVDLNGLANVLVTLSDICKAKADHLEHTYQDSRGAAWWLARAKVFDVLADKPFMKDA
jgi:hypothetical protein